MKKTILGLSIICVCLINADAKERVPEYLKSYVREYQQNPRATNLKWFKEAQFGLFIHYGLYSQLGRGEWVQLFDTIDFERYTKLKDTFTAKNFDANAFVKLAKKAGMKYITITAKHHEGFCLFKTKQTDYNSINSPAKRDLIGEIAKACEKGKIGLFIYYSLAADWHHPYFYNPQNSWVYARPAYLTQPTQYKYQNPTDFRKYIDFVHAQLKEILTQYPSVAGIWFDPVMGYYSNPDVFPISETYALIRKLSPHALISFKQGANGDEDFIAPERGAAVRMGEKFPIAKQIYELNKNKPKEVCNTMQPHLPNTKANSTWGYNKDIDGKHLNVNEVKRLLTNAKENNYNLLLNIGPLPDGSIHPEDVETLSNLQK